MVDIDTKPFNETVCFEDDLPIVWLSDDSRSAGPALRRLHEDNVQTLQAVGILEEYHKDLDSDGRVMARDIARLEFKLNLLMSMVGRLSSRGVELPPRRRVRIYGGGVEWLMPDAAGLPEEASPGVVSVYLHPSYAHPLTMPGRVEYLRSGDDGTVVGVGFDEIPTTVEDEVERLIFRHHRRALAEARQSRQNH